MIVRCPGPLTWVAGRRAPRGRTPVAAAVAWCARIATDRSRPTEQKGFMMITAPFTMLAGHPFVTLDNQRWLFDTGAPTSFGDVAHLTIGEHTAQVQPGYLGLTARMVAQHTGVDCAGLLGADLINRFDWVLDARAGSIAYTIDQLEHVGERHPMEDVLGIPLIDATIGGQECRVIFDTGAQYSYAPADVLDQHEVIGRHTDFLPGMGTFETDLRRLPVTIGAATFALECGQLPDMLALALMLTGATGIIGAALLQRATIGYAPRRSALFLS
jgi:hypothetical protein